MRKIGHILITPTYPQSQDSQKKGRCTQSQITHYFDETHVDHMHGNMISRNIYFYCKNRLALRFQGVCNTLKCARYFSQRKGQFKILESFHQFIQYSKCTTFFIISWTTFSNKTLYIIHLNFHQKVFNKCTNFQNHFLLSNTVTNNYHNTKF